MRTPLKNKFALAIIFILSGCQTNTLLDLKNSDSQKRFFTDGVVSVVSEKPSSAVAIAYDGQALENGKRITLLLFVQNRSNQLIEINTSNVSVLSNAPKRILVYSYEQLLKEEVDRRNAAIMLTALGGALRSASAAASATQRTSGTYSSTGYVGGTGYSSSGTYTSTTYDSGQAAVATSIEQARTQNDLARIQDSSSAKQANLKATILKRTTVFPRTSHSGYIVFDAPPIKNDEKRIYEVTINVGTEHHTFEIHQSITD